MDQSLVLEETKEALGSLVTRMANSQNEMFGEAIYTSWNKVVCKGADLRELGQKVVRVEMVLPEQIQKRKPGRYVQVDGTVHLMFIYSKEKPILLEQFGLDVS